MPVSQWNPTRGFYTRYGDVRELVTAIDDRLLIMGSGDEVRLHYPAQHVTCVYRERLDARLSAAR